MWLYWSTKERSLRSLTLNRAVVIDVHRGKCMKVCCFEAKVLKATPP
jgi:hypothetical protein